MSMDDIIKMPTDRKSRHGPESVQRIATLYQRFLNSRAHKKPPPHELDPRAAAGAFKASVGGMALATRSRYVIDKFTKYA